MLRHTFVPSRALAGAADGEGVAALAPLATFVEGKVAEGGQVTVYVCERGKCQLPTHDPAVLAEQLRKRRGTDR